MVKKKTKNSSLTLHGLLVALSYWGTATRLLLVGFVSLTVFAIALSETSGTAPAVGGEVILLIYLLASVFLLDFGYVMIARAMPLRRVLDTMSLLFADLALLAFYSVPKVTVAPAVMLANPIGVALLVAVLVLALRLLSGFLFSPKSKA